MITTIMINDNNGDPDNDNDNNNKDNISTNDNSYNTCTQHPDVYGCTVEVCEWISNFNQRLTMGVITYPYTGININPC